MFDKPYNYTLFKAFYQPHPLTFGQEKSILIAPKERRVRNRSDLILGRRGKSEHVSWIKSHELIQLQLAGNARLE